MIPLNIVPECYVDTRVAQILIRTSTPNHQHGHGNVANKMKFDLYNQIALGIIDQDTIKVRKSDYFNEFNTITATDNNLILRKHKTLEHYLIIICPQMEKWLMYNAVSVNVMPEEYNLPQKLTGFIKLCKQKDIDKDTGFTNFIKALLNRKALGIFTLQTWLTDFLEGQNIR